MVESARRPSPAGGWVGKRKASATTTIAPRSGNSGRFCGRRPRQLLAAEQAETGAEQHCSVGLYQTLALDAAPWDCGGRRWRRGTGALIGWPGRGGRSRTRLSWEPSATVRVAVKGYDQGFVAPRRRLARSSGYSRFRICVVRPDRRSGFGARHGWGRRRMHCLLDWRPSRPPAPAQLVYLPLSHLAPQPALFPAVTLLIHVSFAWTMVSFSFSRPAINGPSIAKNAEAILRTALPLPACVFRPAKPYRRDKDPSAGCAAQQPA